VAFFLMRQGEHAMNFDREKMCRVRTLLPAGLAEKLRIRTVMKEGAKSRSARL